MTDRQTLAAEFDTRARQVLSQKPLLSAKDLEVTFSLRGQNSPQSVGLPLTFTRGKHWLSWENPVPGRAYSQSVSSV